MVLDNEIIEILACPRCKQKLDDLDCSDCRLTFPEVGGVPVLLNEENSLFKISDLTELQDTTYRKASQLKAAVKGILPSITLNVNTRENFQQFFALLLRNSARPRLLVIGGAVPGQGLEDVPPEIEMVETDIAIGPRTSISCDAHDLPFLDGSFDGVVAQAVLEHVLQPAECVAEILRVLKKGGIVYAETPFMQQVHAGRYDFMRFTHLGHRYLFRDFSEITSGACCGPASAFVWSYCYFLQSFFRSKTLGQIAFTVGTLTSFWIKYFDLFLANRPNAYDASSGYFFLGEKNDTPLTGIDLIAGYKGMIQ